MQVLGLQTANGLKGLVRDYVLVIGDAGHALERVEQKRRRGAQDVVGLARHDGAVRKHHGASGHSRLFRAHEACLMRGRVVNRHVGLVHQQLDLGKRGLARARACHLLRCVEVTADNLVAASFAADLVVADAVAHHVDAHVGGGLVGALAHDLLHHGLDHREGLHVTVVVDRDLVVGLEVERVNDVAVVKVGRCGLVGNVDGVLELEVPDGEGLKFRVAGVYAMLVLVEELREARGQLARPRTRSRDHHERARRLDKVILAKALIAHDVVHVGGVAVDEVMAVAADAHALKVALPGLRMRLAGEVRNDHAVCQQPHATVDVHQAQRVLVVGDANVRAALGVLDVLGVNGDDDLGVVCQLGEHAHLGVRLKAGEHAACVVVIEEFSAKL